MLRQRPGVFVAGEMIDWEAPTGGYLLQACFATGAAAGRAAARWASEAVARGSHADMTAHSAMKRFGRFAATGAQCRLLGGARVGRPTWAERDSTS